MKGGAFESKYGKLLTVLLIVLIIVAVALIGVLAVNLISDYNAGAGSAEAATEFEKNAKKSKVDVVEKNNDTLEIDDQLIADYLSQQAAAEGDRARSTSGDREVQSYEGFEMVGTIEIPATKIKYPILADLSKASIEKAIAVMYPSNAELNSVGNVVLVGHNYRNGTFFSNNKKLKEGDKIYITDVAGNKVEYKIYSTFITTPEDFSFGPRDTAGKREITLSTCTDDVKSRLIILASAD